MNIGNDIIFPAKDDSRFEKSPFPEDGKYFWALGEIRKSKRRFVTPSKYSPSWGGSFDEFSLIGYKPIGWFYMTEKEIQAYKTWRYDMFMDNDKRLAIAVAALKAYTDTPCKDIALRAIGRMRIDSMELSYGA